MPQRRPLSILEDDDGDDPILSVVNIVDVFLVVIVVLLIAILENPLNPFSQQDVTVIKDPGKPTMEMLVKQGKDGDAAAGRRARELLASLPLDRASQLVRAFAAYFHLANAAEQVHRVRSLAARPEQDGWLAATVPSACTACCGGWTRTRRHASSDGIASASCGRWRSISRPGDR